MKKGKLLSICLALVLCVSLVGGAYAASATTSDTGEVTVEGPEGGAAASVDEDEAVEVSPNGELAVEGVFDESVQTPDAGAEKVSVSLKDKEISVGTSYKKNFKMNISGSDPHTAFRTIVTKPTSAFKIIVKGSDGYSYRSAEHTSSWYVTITNAKPDVTYTVYVLNCSDEDMTANIQISSYYN
ncbi:MAG: hypothetical protein LIO78_11175 [Clostridiales bacterium]|nr:hypothetical protein [Clostridiales bacterium]